MTTPLAETTGYELAVSGITVVPILRAGLGFLDAVLDLIPEARVGHIGLTRDEETLEPIKYYCKIPQGQGCGDHPDRSHAGNRRQCRCGPDHAESGRV